jgi:hypothetical protein
VPRPTQRVCVCVIRVHTGVAHARTHACMHARMRATRRRTRAYMVSSSAPPLSSSPSQFPSFLPHAHARTHHTYYTHTHNTCRIWNYHLCVCGYYCSTYYKAVRVGGWGHGTREKHGTLTHRCPRFQACWRVCSHSTPVECECAWHHVPEWYAFIFV